MPGNKELYNVSEENGNFKHAVKLTRSFTFSFLSLINSGKGFLHPS